MRLRRQKPNPAGAGHSSEELGRFITRAHYQAWRTEPPPLDLSVDALASILPNLIKSGSAGLIWPRVEPVREQYGALAFALEAAYHSIQQYNERAQDAIPTVVGRLNDAGIEPILVKGWSMTQQYPAPLLRPAGDIDLRVRRDEYVCASEVLSDPTLPPVGIDVDMKHPGMWKERPNDEPFWKHLRTIEVQGVPVHTLGDADQLRMLCFHYLIHGGVRALWACDIALAFESIDAQEFNRRVVPDGSVKSGWMLTMLAHVTEMLGARTDLAEGRSVSMPRWFPDEIERQWLLGRVRLPIAEADLQGVGLLRTLVRRWPEPIIATVQCGLPITNAPWTPAQSLACARKVGIKMLSRMEGRP
jgi:hypothetical protein